MIATEIISLLHTVNATGPSNQTIGTTISCKSTNHLKGLDIETFKELPDPSLIRPYIFRTFLLPSDVDLNRRLKGASKRRSTICESLIGLKLWQRLDSALRPRAHLIHICLKI
ncbi:hypothetical protein SAMN05878282_101800 [Aquipseudomonas alcaligenes]|uniref:Uncharacterized protein n=1 Tax=Aquipseudomonas alcaligenes TaxID=43263 RepID=A0A1N6P6W3_AQUAC|nr:hypothetical protein SAMN05878282_101800 [Pseudomonas alcaligenes]